MRLKEKETSGKRNENKEAARLQRLIVIITFVADEAKLVLCFVVDSGLGILFLVRSARINSGWEGADRMTQKRVQRSTLLFKLLRTSRIHDSFLHSRSFVFPHLDTYD